MIADVLRSVSSGMSLNQLGVYGTLVIVLAGIFVAGVIAWFFGRD